MNRMSVCSLLNSINSQTTDNNNNNNNNNNNKNNRSINNSANNNLINSTAASSSSTLSRNQLCNTTNTPISNPTTFNLTTMQNQLSFINQSNTLASQVQVQSLNLASACAANAGAYNEKPVLTLVPNTKLKSVMHKVSRLFVCLFFLKGPILARS